MVAEVNQVVFGSVFMMALKINIPVFIGNYERYRTELEAWREITDFPKAKQGIAVALSLPSESSSDIPDKVFEQLTIIDLKAENGFETLLAFLDRENYKKMIYLQIMTNSVTLRNFVDLLINPFMNI